MKPSSIFIATLLFFGLFTGGQVFMSDLWTEHDVQTNTSITFKQDYQKMQDSVNANNNSLRSKIETLTTDQGGIIDAASAGLLLVPQFVEVLAQPFTSLLSALNSVSAAFPAFVPGWFVTLIKVLIVAVLGFGIFSVAVGVKS